MRHGNPSTHPASSTSSSWPYIDTCRTKWLETTKIGDSEPGAYIYIYYKPTDITGGALMRHGNPSTHPASSTSSSWPRHMPHKVTWNHQNWGLGTRVQIVLIPICIYFILSHMAHGRWKRHVVVTTIPLSFAAFKITLAAISLPWGALKQLTSTNFIMSARPWYPAQLGLPGKTRGSWSSSPQTPRPAGCIGRTRPRSLPCLALGELGVWRNKAATSVNVVN